jgi:hypothetical protein
VTTSEPAEPVRGFAEIIEVNLSDEKEAVDYYRRIHAMIKANEKEFPYEFETLEQEVSKTILSLESRMSSVAPRPNHDARTRLR